MANYTAKTTVDNLLGKNSKDTFFFSSGTVQAGDKFNGAAGTDTIAISSGAALDFSVASVTSFERLSLGANAAATFNASQFGAGLSNSLFIGGSSNGTESLTINSASNFSAAAWTFAAWSAGDSIRINGSTGSDAITGSKMADAINGLGGDDAIAGGAGADNLTGGLGADRFIISSVDVGERIDGTVEAATIDRIELSTAGTYNLSAASITNIDAIMLTQNGAGYVVKVSDALVSNADANGDGTGGDLKISASVALTNGVTIQASTLTSSNAIIVDGTNFGGNDVMTGGAGNDFIGGGAGNDTIAGGAGVDTAVFSGAWLDYTITSTGTGSYTVTALTGTDGTDTLTGIEQFKFANGTFAAAADRAPDSVNDSNGADAVTEAGGLNNGVAGDSNASGNVLANDSDANSVFGDTISVTGIRAGTVLDGGTLGGISGSTIVQGQFGTLFIAADGSYTYTLDNNDADTQALGKSSIGIDHFSYRVSDAKGGWSVADIAISVNGANDNPVLPADVTITLAENTKPVMAVAAADADADAALVYTIVGGTDAAKFTINKATGQLNFVKAPGFEIANDSDHNHIYKVIVQVSDGTATDTQAITVNVTNLTGAKIVGSAGGDIVDATHTVAGQSFATIEEDTISGMDGDDMLNGLGGNDTISGGRGNDVLVGGLGKDKLTGDVGNDTLNGDAGNDTLNGGAGTDIINGGIGIDRIIGGTGRDVMTGGLQKDVFIFSSLTQSAVGAQRDVITDFTHAQNDKISLAAIDAIVGGGNDAFHLTAAGGTGEFTGAAGELRYYYENGNTIVAGNVDAGTGADFEICLTGIHVLTALDFIL